VPLTFQAQAASSTNPAIAQPPRMLVTVKCEITLTEFDRKDPLSFDNFLFGNESELSTT